MPASSSELAIAVAAGVGIGVGALLAYKRLSAPAKVPIIAHVDAELAPKKPKEAKRVVSRSPTLPAFFRVKEEAPPPAPLSPPMLATASEQPPDSSSHLSAHHLSTWQDDESAHKVWPRPAALRKQVVANPMSKARPHMNFLNPGEKVRGSILLNDSKASLRSHALDGGCIRGNATQDIWWEPRIVKAALITAGGLCPGLNSIIQGVTNCLWRDYGVRDIVGVTAGYNGLSAPELHPSIQLTPEVVETIHLKGGSILKAGRGGFDAPKICETLRARGFTHLFVIGGDGTQFAGHLL